MESWSFLYVSDLRASLDPYKYVDGKFVCYSDNSTFYNK